MNYMNKSFFFVFFLLAGRVSVLVTDGAEITLLIGQ